jgi:hypothetical protein
VRSLAFKSIRMPSVQIVTEIRTGEKEEVVLLEFQGKVETNAQQFNGLELGELHIVDDEPVFIIGNQKLVGKLAILKTPFALLEQSQSDLGQTQMRITQLISKKYFFNTRPTTIISDKGIK